MVKPLDVLGWAKWPSLFLVAAFPWLAYRLGDWSAAWEGRAQALYGPSVVGEVGLLASHPASARPRSTPTRWTVRIDERACARVVRVRVAYGVDGASIPAGGWQPLQALHRREWSGELAAPSNPVPPLHLWLAVELVDGATLHHAWPLDAPL